MHEVLRITDETAGAGSAARSCADAAHPDQRGRLNADPNDPATLIEEIGGKDAYELEQNIEEAKTHCDGASRKGANGARAKLEYVKEAALQGTTVYIANGKYSIADILAGKVRRTAIRLR